MSTRLQEKEEAILQILQHLAEESKKGIPIIVEGKKDVEALRAFCIEGPIISAKSGGKTFLDLVSEIEKCRASEAILLLDFDRRGKEWTKKLKERLEKTHAKPNVGFWNDLWSLLGRELKDVEGLTAYMETLKSKISNS